jgi:hypothetical protein
LLKRDARAWRRLGTKGEPVIWDPTLPGMPVPAEVHRSAIAKVEIARQAAKA